MKNTKKKGNFQIFSYFDSEIQSYVGVCLEFNIVLTGNDPAAVANEVMRMSLTHIQTVKNLNLSNDLLNRHAPKEYWDLFEKIKSQKNTTVIQSPYSNSLEDAYV